MTEPAPTNRAPTDGHSRTDRDGGTDPDIVLDHDGCMRDEVVSLVEIEGMSAGRKSDPGTDHHSVSDRDAPEVKEEASLIDEHLLSEPRAQAVVAMERWQHGQRLGDVAAEDLGEQSLTAFQIVKWQRVQMRREAHDQLDPIHEGPRLRGPAAETLLVAHHMMLARRTPPGSSAAARRRRSLPAPEARVNREGTVTSSRLRHEVGNGGDDQ